VLLEERLKVVIIVFGLRFSGCAIDSGR